MPLIYFIVWIAVIGLATWAILKYVPMPEPFKIILIAGVAICLVIWFLQLLGITGPMVPRIGG